MARHTSRKRLRFDGRSACRGLEREIVERSHAIRTRGSRVAIAGVFLSSRGVLVGLAAFRCSSVETLRGATLSDLVIVIFLNVSSVLDRDEGFKQHEARVLHRPTRVCTTLTRGQARCGGAGFMCDSACLCRTLTDARGVAPAAESRSLIGLNAV